MNWNELMAEWNSEADSMLCHTSGSTGTPKEIRIPKKEMIRSARRTVDHFRLDATSHLHSCIAPDFIGGKMVMVRSIVSGATFSWEKPSNRPLESYSGPAVDLLSVVPSQMRHILDHPDRMPPIRSILIGGSPIDRRLRKRIAESGLDAWESYGMTETASHIALRRVTEPENAFTPLPGIHTESVNGALRISIEGWKSFMTNDLVEFDTGGTFRILGRTDNMIITGGMKVSPESVEKELESFLDAPVMITSEPDELWGQRILLLIEGSGMDDDSIMRICRERLPRQAVPKRIVRGPLPLTSNGKLKRH